MDLEGEEPGEVSKCMADGRTARVALSSGWAYVLGRLRSRPGEVNLQRRATFVSAGVGRPKTAGVVMDDRWDDDAVAVGPDRG